MLHDANSGPPPASGTTRLDLSKIRHDLRNPINLILGFCEMLQEEEQVPPDFQPDLARIRAGGRQLLALITEYFDEETFEGKQHDLHQLSHELRTPVNHIVGYTELLEELAEERGLKAVFSDLNKIRSAAQIWLELMEEYLVFPQVNAGRQASLSEPSVPTPVLLQPGIGFAAPVRNTILARLSQESHLLVVDDDEANRDMLSRRLIRFGCKVSAAASGLEALRLLRSRSFDLVLLDMVMPGLDGYQVLTKIKMDAALAEVPVIMISALDQEASVARCIEAGAEDYVPKPFNSVLLRARIWASLEKRNLRIRERKTYEALLKSQKHLAAELAKAADYVRSLLPAPLKGVVETEWCFQPSDQLGGDAFGYHWIDPQHLAIYLIDVCGHGVGAALLSVSVLNALRNRGIAGVDFRDPAAVLSGLNKSFPMEAQNNLYFTAWYGVYDLAARNLAYSSGGHPPAVLLQPAPDNSVASLATNSPALGCFPESVYQAAISPIAPGARLLVLSDGVYEIFGENQKAGTWAEFEAGFQSADFRSLTPEKRLVWARRLRGADSLEDDFSLIELRFS